jgi:hypothetical protein
MDAVESSHLCPVCGYALGFPPWRETSASDEICPACGIQFGYHDAAGGNMGARSLVYEKWRQQWIKNGMQWDKGRSQPPPGWDPVAQLKRIGVRLQKS